MFQYNTTEGDTVEIKSEEEDRQYRTDLYVEHSDGDNICGRVIPDEESQLSPYKYMTGKHSTLFEIRLSKANESMTYRLKGCRFRGLDGEFTADFIDIES